MKPTCIASLALAIATMSGSSLYAQAELPTVDEARPANEIDVLGLFEKASPEQLKMQIQQARQRRVSALGSSVVWAEKIFAKKPSVEVALEILKRQTELAEAEYEIEPTSENLLTLKKRRWEIAVDCQKRLRTQNVGRIDSTVIDTMGDDIYIREYARGYVRSLQAKAEAEYLEEVAAQRAKEKTEK